MKSILLALPFMLLCSFSLSAEERNSKYPLFSIQDSFAEIAEQYEPLVVSVTGKKVVLQPVLPHRFYFGTPYDPMFDESFPVPEQQRYIQKKFEGGGSGVVVSSDGYILTNYHVVSFADDITIHFAKKDKAYEADLVLNDPETDLAVLKIRSDEKFPYAELGNSDKLKIGSWVIAIGSPFGLEQTITAGIVSARRQSLDIEGKKFEDMIQTDAAINRGNSGGPLVNIEGKVIGINTAIFAPTGVFSGIGFAIPIKKAESLIKKIKENPKITPEKNKFAKGIKKTAWFGLFIENISPDIEKTFALPQQIQGVAVTDIYYNKDNKDFGLMKGDIIRSINKQIIRNVDDFIFVTGSVSLSEGVFFEVIRNGRQFFITYREQKS